MYIFNKGNNIRPYFGSTQFKLFFPCHFTAVPQKQITHVAEQSSLEKKTFKSSLNKNTVQKYVGPPAL
jgi:hypothetical protein